jgi:hypothetical protein
MLGEEFIELAVLCLIKVLFDQDTDFPFGSCWHKRTSLLFLGLLLEKRTQLEDSGSRTSERTGIQFIQ